MTKDLELTLYALQYHFTVWSVLLTENVSCAFIYLGLILAFPMWNFQKFLFSSTCFTNKYRDNQRQGGQDCVWECILMPGRVGSEQNFMEASVLDAWIGIGENGSYIQVLYVNEFGICKYMPTICWVWQKARESCSTAFRNHLLLQHNPATADWNKNAHVLLLS